MKLRLLFFIIILLFESDAFSQAGEWTWVKGADTVDAGANYGVQGVEAATNQPLGFYEACEWTDTAGNFWMYGGLDSNGFEHGALWRFNPVTTNWTWIMGAASNDPPTVWGVQGVPSINNTPGARGFGVCTWVDKNDDLWLFSAGQYIADLWRYNIATNTWTWMQGADTVCTTPTYGIMGVESANNNPAGRTESGATWVDDTGNLWMYGGSQNGENSYADLWRYNVYTNLWAWMSGSDTLNSLPVYGTRGVPSAGNRPGSRWVYSTWKDASGNFWLFGGGHGLSSWYNDLWRYEPASGLWTWISGKNTTNNYGIYGSTCASDTGWLPAVRMENRVRWKDDCGNLWLYGGSALQGLANDLWYFNPATLKWTFVNGSDSGQLFPVYGTMGVAAPANNPGGRAGAISWRSKTGELYLYGGQAPNGSSLGFGVPRFNDIWKFTIDPACGDLGTPPAINLGSDTTYCNSFSRVLSAGYNNAIWSTGDTAAQITVTQPGVYSVIVNTTCGTSSDTIQISESVISLLVDSTATSCGNNTGGVSVTVDTGLAPYIYHWNTGSSSDTLTELSAGVYSVTVTDQPGCTASTSAEVDSSSAGSVNITAGSNNICPGDSTTLCAPNGYAAYIWSNGDSTKCITVKLAGNYYLAVTENSGCPATSSPLAISVLSPPAVNINISGDTLRAFNAITYQWYYNNVPIPGDTDSVLIATRPGIYSVEVSDSNGCLVMSNNQTVTGINNLADEMSLKLYPDPATDELNVAYNLNKSANLQISIMDITGQRITNVINEKELNGSYLQHINIRNLASAVYILNFTTDSGSVNLKFVKE